MDPVRRVRKTDLARNSHDVIRAVQRGDMALVENHGEAEVAIIDIVDYRILRSAMRYFARKGSADLWKTREPSPEQVGLSQEDVDALSDVQDRYDLVLANYLEGEVSLARAAELLGMSWIELHTRFWRLDIPMETSPADLEEARGDAETALRLAESRR